MELELGCDEIGEVSQGLGGVEDLVLVLVRERGPGVVELSAGSTEGGRRKEEGETALGETVATRR